MIILSLSIFFWFTLLIEVSTFTSIPNLKRPTFCHHAKPEEGDSKDANEGSSNNDEDWRSFRARLVMNEKKRIIENNNPSLTSDNQTSCSGDLDGIGQVFTDNFVENKFEKNNSSKDELAGMMGLQVDGMTPLDPSQWAYESIDVIERGAVILGGIEHETFGFGLRQQYFHKVAMLVLDHSPTFTKGIILNRPTDLMLEDDINIGMKWKVWFGGDCEGMNTRHPDIICLHSLKNERSTKASIPVMKDIQWTSFDNAKKLVKAGCATVSDFWVFVGYAGWGGGQLKGELERSSWYMVATDSQTLLKELARQAEGLDPRDAGLETWTLLMNMIGRSEKAKKYQAEFDDLMLKEWAFSNLLSTAAGGAAGKQERDPNEFSTNSELVPDVLPLMDIRSKSLIEGSLVSASAMDRSPFLLQKQEFHTSIVLILKDEKIATVGVILNRPSTKGIDIQVDDLKTGGKKVVTIPLRFGGSYSVQGTESLLWIHSSRIARESRIGSPINEIHGIWKCTTKDVMKAVGQGIVPPEDFFAISGVSVWVKDEKGNKEQGIQGELELGNFEMVPESVRENAWKLLKQQVVLKESNFVDSLKLSKEAWSTTKTKISENNNAIITEPIGGLGENFDEENDALVFKSNYRISQLSDDALRGWCAVFLLGMPNFRI